MKLQKLYKFGMLLFAFLAMPNDLYAGDCSTKNAKNILDCAIEKHPNVLRAKSKIPVALENKNQSGVWFAPEVDSGIGYSRDNDDKGVQADLALLQTIEMPSKRKARKDKGAAELSYAELLLEEQKELVIFDTLTILNRLRQISKEKSVVNETISTFQSILKKYNNRPTLSPEDEISKEVFALALSDYEIEYSQLINEEKMHFSKLSISLGKQLKPSNDFFLYPLKRWPKIDLDNSSYSESIELSKEDLDVKIAKAEYLDAKSSNASFRVGPYIETKPGDLGRVDTYGVKFSFPLPINSNKYAKRSGRFSLDSAKNSYDLRVTEVADNYQLLKERYLSGVTLLKNNSSYNVEQRHKKVENLFSKGRVSSSLFIEAHRQMVDVVKTNHQYELETLQAIWSIYMIERKLISNFEEFINV